MFVGGWVHPVLFRTGLTLTRYMPYLFPAVVLVRDDVLAVAGKFVLFGEIWGRQWV